MTELINWMEYLETHDKDMYEIQSYGFWEKSIDRTIYQHDYEIEDPAGWLRSWT